MRQTDHGAKALFATIRATRGLSVRVGVIGDRALEIHEGTDLTIGDIANAHEFGVGHVPERSWLRETIDANKARIQKGLQRQAALVASGKMTPRLALGRTGAFIAGLCQQRIADGIAPPLSEKYLPRKLAKFPGAETPLIASGQFRSSITSEVVEK